MIADVTSTNFKNFRQEITLKIESSFQSNETGLKDLISEKISNSIEPIFADCFEI